MFAIRLKFIIHNFTNYLILHSKLYVVVIFLIHVIDLELLHNVPYFSKLYLIS